MEYHSFFQFLVNGLITGGVYALIAIGYTMVYGILKFINFAHGDVCMVAGYLVYALAIGLGVNFILAIPIVISVTGGFGVLIYLVAYRPLLKRSRLAPLISAIGVSIFLQNIIALVFGHDLRSLRTHVVQGVSILGIRITYLQISIIIISVGLMILLHLFLKRTNLGKAMRATSQDREASLAVGINTNRVI